MTQPGDGPDLLRWMKGGTLFPPRQGDYMLQPGNGVKPTCGVLTDKGICQQPYDHAPPHDGRELTEGDFCRVCRDVIRTQIFRGLGYCGIVHQKLIDDKFGVDADGWHTTIGLHLRKYQGKLVQIDQYDPWQTYEGVMVDAVLEVIPYSEPDAVSGEIMQVRFDRCEIWMSHRHRHRDEDPSYKPEVREGNCVLTVRGYHVVKVKVR